MEKEIFKFIIIIVVFVFIYNKIFKSKKDNSNEDNNEDDIEKPYKSIVEYDRKKIQELSKQLLLRHITTSKNNSQAVNHHHIINQIIDICKSENIPYTTEKINEIFESIENSDFIQEEISRQIIKIEKQAQAKIIQKEKEIKRKEELAKRIQEQQKIEDREIKFYEDFKEDISSKINYLLHNNKYSDIKKDYESIVLELIDISEKNYSNSIYFKQDIIAYGRNYEDFIRNTLSKSLELKKEKLMKNSPLYDYFGAIEGGETTLYYLKLNNKFDESRYKVGVTLQNVKARYNGINHPFVVLYEKKLTHANTIEKQILKEFNYLVTDESLLGTNGSEIFKEDVLKLDK